MKNLNELNGLNGKSFEQRVNQLESLVEELLKDCPAEPIIEKKMTELEITYTPDPVERINRVLEALHPYQALDFIED
jgi:hypothetical protein